MDLYTLVLFCIANWFRAAWRGLGAVAGRMCFAAAACERHRRHCWADAPRTLLKSVLAGAKAFDMLARGRIISGEDDVTWESIRGRVHVHHRKMPKRPLEVGWPGRRDAKKTCSISLTPRYSSGISVKHADLGSPSHQLTTPTHHPNSPLQMLSSNWQELRVILIVISYTTHQIINGIISGTTPAGINLNRNCSLPSHTHSLVASGNQGCHRDGSRWRSTSRQVTLFGAHQ